MTNPSNCSSETFNFDDTVEPPVTVYLSGHSGSRIAVQSFQALCKGGGGKIPLLSAIVDERFKRWNVSFAKPLKKLLDEEIQEYIATTVASGLTATKTDSEGSRILAYQSNKSFTSKTSATAFPDVNLLVNEFMSKLQSANFQSVPTVVQTLDKLGSAAINSYGNDGKDDDKKTDGKEIGSTANDKGRCNEKNLYKFGWCRCCLGPQEALKSKENSPCLWGRRQLEVSVNNSQCSVV